MNAFCSGVCHETPIVAVVRFVWERGERMVRRAVSKLVQILCRATHGMDFLSGHGRLPSRVGLRLLR